MFVAGQVAENEPQLGPTGGDAAREQAATAELRSWIRKAFGIDLKKVKLTRQGLFRR